MTTDADLFFWVLVWLVTALFLAFRHWRTGESVGLLVGYVVSFGAIHWLAPALCLAMSYQRLDPALVALGTRQAAIAMLMLAAGAESTSIVMARRGARDASAGPVPLDPVAVNFYLAAGLIMQVVLFPIAHGIPSVMALVSCGSTLIVVAVALKCWNAWVAGDRRSVWLWLLASILLPFFTVATEGFLGYGMAAMMAILAFAAVLYGPRWKIIVTTLAVAYLGLSVYVTYMRDRSNIREVVWGGSSLNDRVDQVLNTLGEFEWFNPNNIEHLSRIDVRLNQNFLIGAAVKYLEQGHVPYARGSTVIDAAYAVVPRALWPEKNVSAGSGDLVSIYTGLQFAKGTSVGIGQVMEWFVNFGTAGVVLGFFFTGALLALIDRSAYAALERGDVQRCTLWFLPGLSLLQVGGSFVEVTSAGGAAIAVAVMLNAISRRTGSRSVLARNAIAAHAADHVDG